MLAEGTGKASSHRRLLSFSDSPTRSPQLTQDWLTTPGDERNKTRLELDAERLVPLAGVARERGGRDDRGVLERLGLDRARHHAGRRRGDRHGRGNLVRRVRREDLGRDPARDGRGDAAAGTPLLDDVHLAAALDRADDGAAQARRRAHRRAALADDGVGPAGPLLWGIAIGVVDEARHAPGVFDQSILRDEDGFVHFVCYFAALMYSRQMR
ncbi:unnamed protein product [Pelagomonas calceolata]|uniref:Uncharacterized protein n=1 Tax=Pelagomonas calceolata TaxID=35677 RepID=A0A8J2SGA8_9STRA|nr:unnamed protein product [Pelagomonas calceolata]